MQAEEWLKRFSREQQADINLATSTLLEFRRSHEQGRILDTCGLYAVGSSVRKETGFNDIDLVLVGVDFRSLFRYEQSFLDGIERYLHGECAEDAMPSKLYGMCEPSQFLKEIEKEMAHGFGLSSGHDIARGYHRTGLNPLEPYGNEDAKFLVSRMQLRSVDFMVHAENLFCTYWKEMQDQEKLPFVVLHEFRNAGTIRIFSRGCTTLLPYPEFIDYKGKERSELTALIY